MKIKAAIILAALSLSGCLPENELKTLSLHGVEKAGYYVGSGLFWLGALVVLAAFVSAVFTPRK